MNMIEIIVPLPSIGVKHWHDWKKVKGNPMNFVCSKCGIIGYISKSTIHVTEDSDADIETTYDCDYYTVISVMTK